MKLFSIPTLGAAQGSVFTDVCPPSTADRVLPAFRDKEEYRKWCVAPNTSHAFVSFFEGMNPGLRVSSANPAVLCHGLIGEFDARTDTMDPDQSPIPPMWMCQSFSGHARAFWPFASPINVEHPKLSEAFLKIAFREVKAARLAPGFELKESCERGKYFEVGRNWTALAEHPIPANVLEGWLFRASSDVDWSKEAPNIPLEKIVEELARRWPAGWPGGWDQFKEGARGVRFWEGGDALAVIVTAAGFVCFTGDKPFVPWSTILGSDWMRQAQDNLIGATVKDIFFYPQSGHFYRETPSLGWTKFNATDLRIHLRKAGLSDDQKKGEAVSQVEDALNYMHNNKGVAYAGSLAGRAAGLRKVAGRPVLVLDSPAVIPPATGEFPVIQQWMDNLFDWESEQCVCILGWLKYSYIAISTHTFRPGQVLALSGEALCGKSIWQNEIITPIVGGRVGDPFMFMSGASAFNGNLFGAEHMMIEDKHSSTSISSRRELGSHFKSFTVNRNQSCHAKGKDAITLDPIWRTSISFNSEAENVCIMPPMDDSIRDKVMLVKARSRPWPMPTETDEQWNAFLATVRAELPAFIHYILSLELDDSLKCPRFGVKSYHNPELLEALSELAPEIRLWELIQASCVFDGGVFKGSQDDLTQKLYDSDKGSVSRMLLSWPNACGTYLARLAKLFPNALVKGHTSSGRHVWTIRKVD